jgi:hypothetical protein
MRIASGARPSRLVHKSCRAKSNGQRCRGQRSVAQRNISSAPRAIVEDHRPCFLACDQALRKHYSEKSDAAELSSDLSIRNADVSTTNKSAECLAPSSMARHPVGLIQIQLRVCGRDKTSEPRRMKPNVYDPVRATRLIRSHTKASSSTKRPRSLACSFF